MNQFITEQEIEFKSKINQAQYDMLMKKYQHKGTLIIQMNYYFDTPNLYYHLQENTTIRIREKNNHYMLTKKSPDTDSFKEESKAISHTLYQQYIKEGINKAILHLDKDVIFIQSLKTIRYTFPYTNGIICIDKSQYNDHIDYEIEYETNTVMNQGDFDVFLKENDLKRTPSSSKRGRALEQKTFI